MPFPNLPEKHRSEPLVTPEDHGAYRRSRIDAEPEDPPQAVILCYSRGLMSHLTETYDGYTIDHYYGDLYVFDDTSGSVGVLGNFGIGAPTTAMLMDELVVNGVGTFLSIGFAGCLDDDIEMGEYVVCERAIRDEGNVTPLRRTRDVRPCQRAARRSNRAAPPGPRGALSRRPVLDDRRGLSGD